MQALHLLLERQGIKNTTRSGDHRNFRFFLILQPVCGLRPAGSVRARSATPHAICIDCSYCSRVSRSMDMAVRYMISPRKIGVPKHPRQDLNKKNRTLKVTVTLPIRRSYRAKQSSVFLAANDSHTKSKPVIPFPHRLKALFFKCQRETERKVGDPPGVKGLRPLKSQNSLLTKLPIKRGKTHGEQKG